MLVLTILLMIASSVLGAFGVLYLKFASEKITFSIRSLVFNLKFILSLALYGLSFIAMMVALKLSDLSIVYPLYALSYIWVALLCSLVLKEKIYYRNWLGFILIIIGITLTTLK